MKGMVGEVIEINNSRGTLKLGIDLFDRTIRTEVDRSLVVLAQP
jgi:transcription antitermination factor NusG